MIEKVRQAMRRVGTRREALGSCPVCGDTVKPHQETVRAWNGTYAHQGCASYHRRRRNSQRVHDSFTAA
jgi:hypothetical protein